jgi:hypothetical protein
VLFRCGRLAEAAASLSRAVELRPSYESALRNLVNCLEPEGRDSEALAHCRKLSRIARDPIDRRYYLAKVLAKEGDREEAEKELCRVLVAAPRHKGALLLLGTLLSERGMFGEVARHLAALVESEPSAFEPLARAKRMTDEDRPLIDRVRSIAERPDLSVMERICVRFGLGKAFEDLGEHSEAMRQYEEGNRLRAMSGRLDRAALVKQYDDMITNLTAESLSHAGRASARAAHGEDKLPALIVGMPRSGTTLVEQILSSHSEVAGGGELTHWSDRVEAGAPRKSRSVRWHSPRPARPRARFRKIGPEARVVTDKLPGNFAFLWAIRLALPEARVIHCRRNPIDTCLSFSSPTFGGSTLTWDDTCLAPERNERPVKTASPSQARQPVYATSVERWRRYEPWLGELRELLPTAEGSAQ